MSENLPRVQVFGEPELIDHLNSHGRHFSHCISIRNPDQQMPSIIKASFQSILELRFYDVESPDQLGPEQTVKRVPERVDVKGVIEYFRKTRSEATGYTIHCWQGISRSPAIALGLLYMMTRSEEKAGAALRQIRPDSRPHQALVRFFDEELECNLTAVNDRIRWTGSDSLRGELVARTDAHLEELPADEALKGLLARATSIQKSKSTICLPVST